MINKKKEKEKMEEKKQKSLASLQREFLNLHAKGDYKKAAVVRDRIIRARAVLKGRANNREAMVGRKHFVGKRVKGIRAGSASNGFEGTIVETGVTINDFYRNPFYVIKCDIDGKKRSYQHVQAIEDNSKIVGCEYREDEKKEIK